MTASAPFLATSDFTLYVGDVRDVLATLEPGSVDCCITSPPYWGLRDYGADGQLGLEPTPDEYVQNMVAVFREVRRVLADHGTCWLNLGDSYASNGTEKGSGNANETREPGMHNGFKVTPSSLRDRAERLPNARPPGLKPKDLVGIPWLVARALQEPFYTGRIAKEQDRTWLAATIDGEGTICGTVHTRKDDGSTRTMPQVFITNSSVAMLDEANRIWPAGRFEHTQPGDGHLGTADVFRWIVQGIESKTAIVRELYPYLIVKRRQALLAYNLLLLMADAKRLGKSSQAQAVRDKRELLCRLMSELNHAQAVDVPSWCVEPPTLYEPGWYLRSDIIWAKPNPMPESVTDRPTKAHEYVFLLSKQPRYFFDQEAVREKYQESSIARDAYGYNHAFGNQFKGSPTDERHPDGKQLPPGSFAKGPDGRKVTKVVGADGSIQHRDGERWPNGGRNIRTVWEIATQPYAEAHFATYPERLVERCLLAGCPVGGTVLDPFMGSGTTALVARKHGRRAVGVELNPEYAELAARRNQQMTIFS